ncbi:MAG: tetratricopeptide repeat protein [Gammaproteobacteria bacterium]
MEAFQLARTQRDVALAEALLPILQNELERSHFIGWAVCGAVGLGSNVALQILEQEIERLDEYHDDQLKQVIIAAYTGRLSMHDREEEALKKLQGFFERIATSPAPPPTLTTKAKAFYLNQYQRLLHGMGEYEQASRIGAEVIALRPEDGTYYYNQSMNLEKLGEQEGMLACIDKYMALMEVTNEPDDDHLRRSVGLYCKASRIEDARRAFAKLKTVNPYKALLISENPDFARVLGG